MLKILITFLLLTPLPVYADYFFPFGDTTENRYFDTLGFSIGSLPSSGICPGCIQYDLNDVVGEYTATVLGNLNTSIDSSGGYGRRRIPYIYDSVSLPPFSTVDFVYWYSNESGEVVNITDLHVFISRSIVQYGDLRNVLDIQGEYVDLPIKYIVYNYPRIGFAKRYDGIGNVNVGATGTLKLDSVQVKAPLLFHRWEASVNEGYALLRVYVRNTSPFPLVNVEYKHSEYYIRRDYSPLEEYMYEYVIAVSDESNLGYASLYTPFEYSECSVLGGHMESQVVGDSSIVVGTREEDDVYINYAGSRLKPYTDSFCVTIAPHTIYSSEILLGVEEEETTEVVEIEEEFEQVLGLKKLPQTSLRCASIYLPLFLVVILLLWYYLKRRF